MKLMLLAPFAITSALLCVDAQADVNRNCVTMLEAQPANPPQKPTSSPRKPCPVAVTYTRRTRSTVAADMHDAGGPSPSSPSYGVRA